MPFGLTNALSIFQSLMNSIFKTFLINFLLLFFDDILLYNKYWEEHVQHADIVLQLLEEQQLCAKTSKSAFGIHKVEYLDLIVSHEDIGSQQLRHIWFYAMTTIVSLVFRVIHFPH
jgi:hypothetical protein